MTDDIDLGRMATHDPEMRERSGAVVLLSGGIDSALCLDLAVETYEEVEAVHADYGQQTRHVEAGNANGLASHYGVELTHIELQRSIGKYAEGVAADATEFDQLRREDGRSSGYVPMRNLTLLAQAAGIADVRDRAAVVHGAQGGDFADYPDCRESFMWAANSAINHSLPADDTIVVQTPLIEQSKTDVLQTAARRGVPLEHTYSCYEGTDPQNPEPCGECPACIERQEAFEAAGIRDPVMHA